MAQHCLDCGLRGKQSHKSYNMHPAEQLTPLIAAGVHPVHARQPRPGHPHHPRPRPEAQAVAVRQDSQGGLEILFLPPVLVECKAQELLDFKSDSFDTLLTKNGLNLMSHCPLPLQSVTHYMI